MSRDSDQGQIPQPPALLFDPPRQETNSAALLLPNTTLFAAPILSILREHYSSFGHIAHWAPVKGFGRVIIVWERVEDAERALREGDYLRLDVDLPLSQGQGGVEQPSGGDPLSPPRRSLTPHKKGTILRLFALAFTPLNPDPATTYLAPPAAEKNFLISPPGSPPEGWEPVVEDAPNATTLASDLQRALETLVLNGGAGRHTRRPSREIILEEGGVTVAVEDTDLDKGEEHKDWDVEECLEDGVGEGAWEMPSQETRSGFGSALGTPSGKMRIIPTAMPPRQ